ncbi:MAG: hypothetical protein FWC34_01285 [Bacteroidetes bacterium]|nr:hypothetical protein [Bacteroidota bacterium]
MKNNFFLIILIAIFAFVSCNKAENETTQDQGGASKSSSSYSASSMRIFNDYDELNREIEKTISFTLEELERYEEANGFNSFGKLADRAMETILNDLDNNRINSANLSQKLSMNSDFIQLVTIEGEQFCQTKYRNLPCRYIMNANRMFQVDDMCWKVFEDARVGYPIQYYQELLNLKDSELMREDINGVIIPNPSRTNNSKGSYSGTQVERLSAMVSYQRVLSEVFYFEESFSMSGMIRRTRGTWYASSEPFQRVLGIWWSAKRDITHNVTVYTKKGSGSDVGSNHGDLRQRKLFSIDVQVNGNTWKTEIGLTSIVGTTRIPASSITW